MNKFFIKSSLRYLSTIHNLKLMGVHLLD